MLKELRTQHRTIIQMVFSGFSNNEIAERLEMSPASVSTIVRSPLGQAYLGGLNDKAQETTLDVRKKLTSLNKNALETFERILDPRQKVNPAVQATVAKDVLDRNGYKPPDRLAIDMTMAVKTDAEIDAEISALESSIKKTTLQDPIKQVAENPAQIATAVVEKLELEKTDPEQDPDQDYFDIDALDILDDATVFTDEPSEADLSGIPADIFNSASKAS
jgi:hypothetical protein